jgi:Protein of unknown function (DUF4446)
VPLDPTVVSWLAAGAAAAAALALLVALAALRRARRPSRSRPAVAPAPRRRAGAVAPASGPGPGASGVDDLRAEVEALRIEVSDALRHLAVVRYDAFSDMGGHLSWSVALLDDAGNGMVLTSIHGRSESRTYAKNVSEWRSEQQLSPEETEAIDFARVGAQG